MWEEIDRIQIRIKIDRIQIRIKVDRNRIRIKIGGDPAFGKKERVHILLYVQEGLSILILYL